VTRLTPELFDQVANRFRALGEPARLRILDALRAGEFTVGDLCDRTGLNQANLSKHLQLLHTLGFVRRRKDGLFVCYSLTNNDVFQLCDIMCGRLADTTTKSPARHQRRGQATATSSPGAPRRQNASRSRRSTRNRTTP
jgi:ArsR family transcriptional regulator